MFRISTLPLIALLLAACGTDLEPKGNGQKEPEPGESRITHVETGDGTLTTTVDATHAESWVFLDLDAAREVDEAAGTWELAFQRMHIIGNGASGVVTAWVEGKEIGAVPDEAQFRADPVDRDQAQAEGVFQTTDPDDPTGAGAWYAYNLGTHSLKPRERVYFVKSDEGRLFALIFLDYYDDAGTSGYTKFKWSEVVP